MKTFFKDIVRNKNLAFSLTYLGIEIILAFIFPFFSSKSYDAQELSQTFQPMSWEHWLGTDSLGRDLFIRLMLAIRISFTVGLAASLVSGIVGVVIGALSGYIGGRFDQIVMRSIDVFYALPFIFLVIILMVVFGSNFILFFIALGLTQWLTMARIVRGQVLSLKEREYVMAARSLGLSEFKILLKHIMPNTLGTIIVYITLLVPLVILDETFISFLGLGIQPPKASLGTLISLGISMIDNAPIQILAPSTVLFLTLYSLNTLGGVLKVKFTSDVT